MKMSWIFIVIATVVIASSTAHAKIQPTMLKCEYLVNPVGIDTTQPRLFWQMESDQRGQKQTAYQIKVASSPTRLMFGIADLWDSGKVKSDQSIQVVYSGKERSSGQRAYWKVRVWDKDGRAGKYSKPAYWEMGLLDAGDWKGKWLAAKPDSQPVTGAEPVPYFRKTFAIDKKIKQARAYVSGVGYYELYLNGKKVGDHVLDPAFTKYDKRVLYVTYDVTQQLTKGQNAVGAVLGSGWYNMHTIDTWEFYKAPWRARPALLCQLRIDFTDGSSQTIATDQTWKVSTGPIVFDGIRNGETYDARLENKGWDTANFNDAAWSPAQVVAGPKGTLCAQMILPIRVMKTIKPVGITEPKPGVFVFDMGQNFAGWARLNVTGPAGTTITLHHEERLNPDGTVDTRMNSKHVKSGQFQTSVYTLRGEGTEVWEPRFTYYGFRYVQVTGWPGKPTLDNLTGCVVHTSFEQTGEFECSNTLLNKIQQCTLWSYVSNFHGYPTDCPHREKQGWTGDAHLAAEAGLYNFNSQSAYTKWMNDFKDEQQPDGNLPGIVPTGGWGYQIVWEKGPQWLGGFGPAWDSAYVLIPWYMYQYCGDTRILQQHYDGMKRYLDKVTSHYTTDYICPIGLEDWCYAKQRTTKSLTSTGYYYADTLVLARTAQILGKKEDSEKYATLASKIKQSFNEKFFDPNTGQYTGWTQTALSCALYQGLVEQGQEERVLKNLMANIAQANWHLDAGILGTKYTLNCLGDAGHADVVYKMLNQTDYPSYGHWLAQGATTLWEQWDGGNSRNHIMFGDVSRWFYRALAGIDIDKSDVAFKKIIIRPNPVEGLSWAKGKVDSMYGPIESSWRRDGGRFMLDVTIPPNTTATAYLPAKINQTITESGKPIEKDVGVVCSSWTENVVVLNLASGKYQFVVQ